VTVDISSLIDSLDEALVALDAGYRVTCLNRAAEVAYGAERQQLLGHTLFEAFPLLQGSEHEAALRDAMEQRTRRRIDGLLPAAGRSIDVEARPTADGGLLLCQCDGAPAQRLDDSFLAMLAHELRGPLAPLRTSLEVLKRPTIPEETKERARVIMGRQLQQMIRLIDDLGDMSRIARGRLELRAERVALHDLIDAATQGVQAALDEKEQALAIDLPSQPVWLRVDRARLVQVLAALLGKMSSEADRGARIEVHAVQDDRGLALGVNAKTMAPLVPASAATAVAGVPDARLDVSLMLAQRLVELHGAALELRSTDEAGKYCGFRLPPRLVD
jgi:signal transduction histidine kinase